MDAAEEIFAARGYGAPSIRDIASAAGAHPASLTYHFGDKANLLKVIFERHSGPMIARRRELLREAMRIADTRERLGAIVRAYLLPAFTTAPGYPGGGTRFSKLRAVTSAEGDPYPRRLWASAFDETLLEFIDAVHKTVPHRTRDEVIWQMHFVVATMYFTINNAKRMAELSNGSIDGEDTEVAMGAIVRSTVRSLLAPAETDGGA